MIEMIEEELQWITKKYKQSWENTKNNHTNKPVNVEEMNTFLETYILSSLNQEEMENIKSGALRVPAASHQARRGLCVYTCSTLWVGRGVTSISPGSGICAVISLSTLDVFLQTWMLAVLPTAPHFYPFSQSCLPLPQHPRLSPGPHSNCYSCGCLVSCLGVLLGAPQRASACGFGRRCHSAIPPPPPPLPPAASAGTWSIHTLTFLPAVPRAVWLTGSWCSGQLSSLCLWGRRAEFRTLVHKRLPGSMK